MPRRELNLQKKIVAAIIARGGVARLCVQTPYTVVGDPDIYACFWGRFIQLEVKEEDEQPTKIQRKRMSEWEAADAWVRVVRSVDEVELLLDEIEPMVKSRG